MFKAFLIIFVLLFCDSCVENRAEITQKTSEIFAQQNLAAKIYQTKNFTIFTAQKISDPKQDIRVYLEGDGKAYITEYQPAQDPTPTSYFFAKLVAQDNFPNIIYIARPCQYVASEKCEEKYWTDARFSAEIIDAIDEVLQEFSGKKLQLIGYSGGGAIANYLATRHENIVSIRTIAGNLDHEKFCEIHAVPYLERSLKPNQSLDRLEKIPQIHFAGSKDKIVPPIIAQEYLQKLVHKNCTQVVEVKGVTHFSGWQERWAELLEIKPVCAAQHDPSF